MAIVTLKNKIKIDIEKNFLEEFCSYANLPNGSILLVLCESSLPDDNLQGVCVSSQLINFAFDYTGICGCPNSAKWDCCVAIAKKWCISRDEFPAYFTYLLGHEFGHAYICLSDIALHIHCCLIHRWIKLASKNVIQYERELPSEQLFDQFGKYLSFKLHGDKKLDFEIDSLKGTANNIEISRLEMIKKLAPKSELNGLRKSIIDFSKAYKNELIKYWKEDFEKKGSYSLTSLISNYDELFEY